MIGKADDYYSSLNAAIAEAKAARLGADATKLEARAFAAYTASSEQLGEYGLAIREILESDDPAIPASMKANLGRCLAEIKKVWP